MQVIADRAAEPELADDLFALITHVHKQCTASLLEAVGTLGLNLSQAKLLHRLAASECELSLGEAAEAIALTLSTASRLVDDLVHRGLVARREDCSDRRLKRIGLTQAGHDALQGLAAARLTGLDAFVASLSDPERATLDGALQMLVSRPEIAACRPAGDRR